MNNSNETAFPRRKSRNARFHRNESELLRSRITSEMTSKALKMGEEVGGDEIRKNNEWSGDHTEDDEEMQRLSGKPNLKVLE
ncbi:unnamed protein product [Allacma fusca]|uniref:Uncharacterized protein n=1 Tax=Allacma fusca TaxID=39272 RepID=A0A8J2L4L2_9HEXA|nr:unnamed protein product [Allacma fusca]